MLDFETVRVSYHRNKRINSQILDRLDIEQRTNDYDAQLEALQKGFQETKESNAKIYALLAKLVSKE